MEIVLLIYYYIDILAKLLQVIANDNRHLCYNDDLM